MKKIYLTLSCIAALFNANAQTLDTIATPDAGNPIVDLVSKGSVLFATAGTNVYKSTNGGVTWVATAAVPSGLVPYVAKPRHMLVASNGDLYVAVTGYYGGSSALGSGVMKSSDNGTTWTSLGSLPNMGGYDETHQLIELPGGNLFLIGDGAKNYKSNLSSASWTQCTASRSVFGMTNYGDTLIVANSGSNGISYSVDRGDSWNLYTVSSNSQFGQWGQTAFIETSQYKLAGYFQNMAKAPLNSRDYASISPAITANTAYYPVQYIKDASENLVLLYRDAGGESYVVKSTDQAQTWQMLGSVHTTSFVKIAQYNADVIGAMGKYIVRLSNVVVPFTAGVVEYSPENLLSLYPNPSTSSIFIHLPTNTNLKSCKILSVTGQVFEHEVTTNSVDISVLPAGVYFIQIDADKAIYRGKFIKE